MMLFSTKQMSTKHKLNDGNQLSCTVVAIQ